ncbi:MAG TPA: DNA mismatch repair protein MutT [Bacteroidales bacterium]|nr:MAG: hypothetical protein A2X11_14965 [Bacteroidetes bacterium GWE2_42_24]OFY31647.1 MAG: hypothetical protein A2X09_08710 [Bacteroidetes bacterium GWF2_43_11]HAQ64457.1 DNA mismatch repair protein MutT [Bacteroidales bacterium]HBZ67092.1 DNA mismatch repair protein MutT [Bacteroidales bacterium]
MLTDQHFPVNRFAFCPACGAESFVQYDQKALLCRHCNLLLYFNSSAAVAAIITNAEGEVLFTIRRRNPAVGLLDLPGGFVDPGETAEEALVREIQEELGLEVIGCNYLRSFANTYHYREVLYHTTDLVFCCTVKSFEGIKADDDVSGYVFRDPKGIDPHEIGLASIQAAIRSYIDLIKTM